MALATRAYAALPPIAQDVLLSSAGLLWRQQRFGGDFRATLERLHASERWDAARIAVYQRERLAAVLAHAFEHVGYYRERLRAWGLRPGDARDPQVLTALPELTKEQVRAAGAALRSDDRALGRLRAMLTSGTTGTPLRIWKTAAAERFQWAVWWRHRGRFGVQLGDPFVTFGARLPALSGAVRLPIWRRNMAIAQTYLPVSLVTPATLPAVIAMLDRGRFGFFAGYPSGMNVVAGHMLDAGLRFAHPPRLVACGSETLPRELAARLGRAFDARVTQVYGMGESAGGFAECEQGSLHLDFELGIAELLPVQGATDTRLRRLVLTGLQNLAMPLVRYAVGDLVRVAERACPCGRESLVIDSVEGRADELLVTPDGRRVYGLNQVFKLGRNVRECQAVQSRMDEVVVRYVPAAGFARGDLAAMEAELAARLGAGVRVRFEAVEQIERTAAGKLRAVVSRLGAA